MLPFILGRLLRCDAMMTLGFFYLIRTADNKLIPGSLRCRTLPSAARGKGAKALRGKEKLAFSTQWATFAGVTANIALQPTKRQRAFRRRQNVVATPEIKKRISVVISTDYTVQRAIRQTIPGRHRARASGNADRDAASSKPNGCTAPDRPASPLHSRTH